MNWKNHLSATFLFALIFLYLAPFPQYLPTTIIGYSIWLVLALISNLIPDLDSRNSKLNQILEPVIYLLSITTSSIILHLYLSLDYDFWNGFVSAMVGLIALLIYRRLTGKHRGYMHSGLFAIFVGLTAYMLGDAILASAVIFGMLMHLFEDLIADMTTIGR